MKRLITDPSQEPRISAFVAERVGMDSPIYFGPHHAIGIEEGGEVIGGAVYCSHNGQNIWAHLAGIPGKQWMTREFLRFGFHYPFVQLGVQRITGWVEASNPEAIRLNHHFGYHIEARLRGAARDGGDVFLMCLWKKDCRFIRQGEPNAQ